MIVFPGDKIESFEGRIGPGLVSIGEEIMSTKAGRLTQTPNASYVDSNQKKYLPSVGEPVIGIITHRLSESYRVDLGSVSPANLDHLAFEGAMKRNKPNLEVGHTVYARVSLAHKDLEPEIECVLSGKSQGFGQLTDGFIVKCSLGMCRKLLAKHNALLAGVASWFQYEIAVGMNGKVWIKTVNPKHTILLSRLIQNADRAPDSKIPALLAKYKKIMDSSE